MLPPSPIRSPQVVCCLQQSQLTPLENTRQQGFGSGAPGVGAPGYKIQNSVSIPGAPLAVMNTHEG